MTDRVWLVQAPLEGATVCLYVLTGLKLAVIDTGFAQHPLDSLAPALSALGLRLADIDVILNTHGHPDHLGGNAAIKDASGAAVHLHRGDAGLAVGPEAHIQSSTDPVAALRLLGRTDEVAAREAFLRARVGPDVGVDRILEDGDVIDLGAGVTVEVVHVPGHTPGSVTYVLRREGIAFTGDAVQAWGSRDDLPPLYFEAARYAASVQRIQDLRIATLCLGHPFRWSGGPAGYSPVRTGHAADQTLRDSLSFVAMADAAVRAVEGAPGLEDLLSRALGQLAPSLQIDLPQGTRAPAAVAATLLAHLTAARRQHVPDPQSYDTPLNANETGR